MVPIRIPRFHCVAGTDESAEKGVYEEIKNVSNTSMLCGLYCKWLMIAGSAVAETKSGRTAETFWFEAAAFAILKRRNTQGNVSK